VLRCTPAGVSVVDFSLGHRSEQDEAGIKRRVECEVKCIALGAMAGSLNVAALGTRMTVEGFLAATSLKNQTPVLHVKSIEFLEGTENGL
jgi:primosomal replication protein N